MNPSPETLEAVAVEMQNQWNDYMCDTQCYPGDFLHVYRGNVTADFLHSTFGQRLAQAAFTAVMQSKEVPQWMPIETYKPEYGDVLGYYEHSERCLAPSMICMRWFPGLNDGKGGFCALPDFRWRLEHIPVAGEYSPTYWKPIKPPTNGGRK